MILTLETIYEDSVYIQDYEERIKRYFIDFLSAKACEAHQPIAGNNSVQAFMCVNGFKVQMFRKYDKNQQRVKSLILWVWMNTPTPYYYVLFREDEMQNIESHDWIRDRIRWRKNVNADHEYLEKLLLHLEGM